jgi:fibronectin type 3 domain-containing protein
MNQMNSIQTNYPLTLVNDKAPPQIDTVSVQPAGGGDLSLTIVTNEYTRCSLAYGAASGNYTQTRQDNLFRYTHQFILTGLAPGQTYYYQVTSTDRSGNVSISPEASVSALTPLYLQVIIR